MKQRSLYLFFILLLWGTHGTTAAPKKDAKDNFLKDNIVYAATQTQNMLHAVGDPTGKNYPRTTNSKGQLATTSIYDWTPGFFPGVLWYLYELTNEESWKEQAEKWTYPLKPIQTFTSNHDIGFMMYCSYGHAERLASQPEYKDILVQSAKSLCTRYNPTIKAIKSWNYREGWDGSKWFYPVIIDNMMNLELLFYASKVTGDPTYRNIAIEHANTTLANHFRKDYSSYHVVDYDQKTGEALHRQTCQGYSDNSTWARGQAWAIYGYTMVYRETKDPKYLKAAENLAAYYLKHLPKDLIPYWDFNAGEPGYTPQGKSYACVYTGKPRDASAAAVVCSALFELGEFTGKKKYTHKAVAMLKSLASENYRAPLGENANFLIMHCTGSLPHKSEIDAPLTYADYYFLEALVRYKKSVK